MLTSLNLQLLTEFTEGSRECITHRGLPIILQTHGEGNAFALHVDFFFLCGNAQ